MQIGTLSFAESQEDKIDRALRIASPGREWRFLTGQRGSTFTRNLEASFRGFPSMPDHSNFSRATSRCDHAAA